MPAVKLSLAISEYKCEPCSLKQGTDVKELIRMIPRAAVMNGELVYTEYWGCPICLEPRFPIKGKKAKT